MSGFVTWLRFQWDRLGDWRDRRWCRRNGVSHPDDPGEGML